MYQIGDLIIFGDRGVNRIEAIGRLDMPWINKHKLYYTFCPVYREGKILVPVDTVEFMRPVITFEEAQNLMDVIPSVRGVNCGNASYKVLKEQYTKLLQTHRCVDLIRLIKTIDMKNNNAVMQGKQPHPFDCKYLKQAEELLYGELSVVLGISKEQVKRQIEMLIAED